MLTFYRSQYSNQSWLSAMASMMDACCLIMVGIGGVRTFQARMTFSVARLAILELARVLRVEQSASSRLSSNDFLYVKVALEESGLKLVESDAETRLACFRATYEPIICGLAEYLMIPLELGPGRASRQLGKGPWRKSGERAGRVCRAGTCEMIAFHADQDQAPSSWRTGTS